MAKRVFWRGSPPVHCDVCSLPLTDTFVDGKTIFGPWGKLCLNCHGNVGVGLGTGKGQKYKRDPENNVWYKE